MTTTAKRRWSRELETEVDGIAFAATGPVLLHGYDPPAGGKWIDDVIPGKLGAFDRSTGERLWIAPCEVGYGRGFGAGVGQQGRVIVLGPSQGGHRIVRMAMADGELLDSADTEPFDDAVVHPEVVVCSNARAVWGLDTVTLQETWRYAREGERYHGLAFAGENVFVVVSSTESGKYGVVRLSANTGAFEGYLLQPVMPLIRGVGASGSTVAIVTCELEFLLDPDNRMDFMLQLASHPDEGPRDTLSIAAMRADAASGEARSSESVLTIDAVELAAETRTVSSSATPAPVEACSAPTADVPRLAAPFALERTSDGSSLRSTSDGGTPICRDTFAVISSSTCFPYPRKLLSASFTWALTYSSGLCGSTSVHMDQSPKGSGTVGRQ